MRSSNDLMHLSPQDFVQYLKREDIRRFYFVYDSQGRAVKTSHARLQPIAVFIQEDRRDFMQHEGLFFQVSSHYDVLMGVFVHRTNRGQGAGGLRYWGYEALEDFLRDGMRLSKGMTRKNALAGLWWGGAKGVMAENPEVKKSDPEIRSTLYKEYGSLVSSLRGCYITAEDVGTNVSDMANVFSQTRFTTCIPAEYGGSGNPSVPTARGIVSGMQAALTFLNLGDLQGKTVAVQGMGNVGAPLIEFLFDKGVEQVIACDIDPDLVARRKEELNGLRLEAFAVSPGDNSFLEADCDILSPCATGAVLNPRTIPNIRAKVICGAANNQLEDTQRDDRLLFDRNITYVPDFLTNRMGIVNCANEQYGYVNDDSFIERHLEKEWEHSIYQAALHVLHESQETGVPPAQVATRQADALSLENHPLFGHRGQQIINSLVEDGWHEGS